MTRDTDCPCGSGKSFAACCEPFITEAAIAETAEALMRSRYTAYSLGHEDYLRATWHPTTRRQNLNLEESVKWLGLKIVRTWDGGPEDREGKVEFVARYKTGGRAQRLHEVSRFVRRGGRWLYVNGEIRPSSG
ncbi:MAG: SEC-C domain-containing protein [Chromatiaceae bacterium]|jgi:SEC-C motif-containing protein|nr:SEC-C domain-containing protein [Chromatiaceae bacterium]